MDCKSLPNESPCTTLGDSQDYFKGRQRLSTDRARIPAVTNEVSNTPNVSSY